MKNLQYLLSNSSEKEVCLSPDTEKQKWNKFLNQHEWLTNDDKSQKIHIVLSPLYKILKTCKTKLYCLQMHIKFLIKRQGND